MLHEQTLQQLRTLRLDGMAAALADPASQIGAAELPFEQRLALLVQREVDWRATANAWSACSRPPG
jgi:hypothetical protein